MSLTELKNAAFKNAEVQREYEAMEAEFKKIERSIENKTDNDDRV